MIIFCYLVNCLPIHPSPAGFFSPSSFAHSIEVKSMAVVGHSPDHRASPERQQHRIRQVRELTRPHSKQAVETDFQPGSFLPSPLTQVLSVRLLNHQCCQSGEGSGPLDTSENNFCERHGAQRATSDLTGPRPSWFPHII